MAFFTDYWFLWLVFALVAYFLFIVLRPANLPDEFETPWINRPGQGYSFLSADDHSVSAITSLKTGEVPSIWRPRMEAYGDRLRSNGVELVVFVNGTYAGFDPVDLIHIAKLIWPGMPERVVQNIRRLSLAGLNRLVKDCGNFLDSYVSLFSSLCGGMPAENFKWSSANHHAARLEGALDLITYLDEKIKSGRLSAKGRVLFVGHSHAGQVFSIVTQLFNPQKRSPLISVAADIFKPRSKIEQHLAAIENLNMDFVTLGMPPRYLWSLDHRTNLLNIINHRGKTHKAGRVRGLLHTVDGDYVQQAGIRGTDTLVAVPKLRLANQRLNDILDGGPNIKRWLADMKLKNRIPRFGYTYLIDYRDRSHRLPNLFRTIFGHGVYTETRFMEFNTRIITEHLYR